MSIVKVVHILPGSGGTFYCENCMRDSALVKALRRRGHDVVMVPMYLPIYTDDATLAENVPVFFGGINCYLQQKFGFFRHTPRWLDRIFDARWILRAAAQRAGSTRASGLGAMTLSMLAGPNGRQAKELDRLVAWLSAEGRPDLVHVSSVLLLGLANSLKTALGVPVVFTTMDEDTWVDNLEPPFNERCWQAMRTQAADVDAFITVSNYYADVIGRRLALPENRLHRVPIGIDITGLDPAPTPPARPVVGYLSRMSRTLGLDILVDAVIALKRTRPGLAGLKLRAMGGKTGDDAAFVDSLRARTAAEGMAEDFEFHQEIDRAHRVEFLRSLTALCVPMPGGEAFGTFIIEALAAGVPVVQPRLGGFTELVERTGGGMLYEPNDASSVARALESMLSDPARARALGAAGREVVLRDYTVERMAERTEQVYRRVLDASRRSLACGALIITAAAGALAGTWPTYHGAYGLDGRTDAAVPDRPSLLWSYKAGSPVSSPPVADATRIYFTTSAGDVTALKRDGTKSWSRRFVETSPQAATQTVSFAAPLLLASGNVIAAGNGGRVYALAPADGRTVWTFDAANAIQGSPAVGSAGGQERIVILTQPNGALFGLDAATGRPAWTNSGAARADGHLASAGSSVVFGSCAAGVHVVSVADGRETAFVATGDGHEIAGGVAVSGDQAFTGTRSGHLVAISLRDNKEQWRFKDATGELFTTPAVSTDRVVFATGAGNVVCVRRGDGAQVWAHAAAAGVAQAPVIAANRVVAALDGTLTVLGLADGKPLWSYKIGDGCTAPALVDGMIVVGADDGTVRAFGAAQP